MRTSVAKAEPQPKIPAIAADNVVPLFSDSQRDRLAELWETLEPVALRVNTGEGTDAYLHSLEIFSREQRLGHAVLAYVSDVMDGGHHKFFHGTAGILWEDAMAGLRAIGAGDCAMILSEAALRVGGSPSPMRAERRNILKRLSPRFHDLDARFARCEALAHLADYIKDNRAAFYFTRAPI